MHSARKFIRLAAVGVASVGLAVSMNASATAAGETTVRATAQEWGGGWNDQRDVSIREKPSTTARKVGTLKKGQIVKCWVSGCSAVDGGSYKCTSTSPTENRWHEVRWNGKKAYAATSCLEWGRVE
ncbi:SH3 domain-containing protein [Streptomyces sp. NPDC059467]|uniref:SH3 domain-containing protein n=1 Tax=Streptomyces sp. NPDC059467 TaxID=3346844 RepID=UPI0036A44979